MHDAFGVFSAISRSGNFYFSLTRFMLHADKACALASIVLVLMAYDPLWYLNVVFKFMSWKFKEQQFTTFVFAFFLKVTYSK